MIEIIEDIDQNFIPLRDDLFQLNLEEQYECLDYTDLDNEFEKTIETFFDPVIKIEPGIKQEMLTIDSKPDVVLMMPTIDVKPVPKILETKRTAAIKRWRLKKKRKPTIQKNLVKSRVASARKRVGGRFVKSGPRFIPITEIQPYI